MYANFTLSNWLKMLYLGRNTMQRYRTDYAIEYYATTVNAGEKLSKLYMFK